jgi:hypothetical protein
LAVHVALVVGALFGLGFARAGSAATASRPEPVAKEIPESDRGHLAAAIERALHALPRPPAPYATSPDDSTLEIDRRAYWDPDAKHWTAPARATAERVFSAPEVSASEPGAVQSPSLEYRVFLNHEPELPEGLASEGDSPRAFPLPGSVAVEVTTITGGEEGGRVALPVSPEAAAVSPTVIRVYIGSREMEKAVRVLLAGGNLAGSIFPAAARAGGVYSVVVELYGPKRTVESLATALDVPALRKLLSAPAKK